MDVIFCLLICQFLSTNGKQIQKKRRSGLGNGVGSRCELTEKAAISSPRWQVEYNKTMHSLAVILKNSSLGNATCSKLINASLTNRVSNSQLITEKPNTCVFTNSCAATENRVLLTVLIPPAFNKMHHTDFKDQLVTMCRAANGGLAPNIVWLSSTISMRGRNRTQNQNATRRVTSNYKPTQYRNSLENVTCLINHPTRFAPIELFVRRPFAISIKRNNHNVKGNKRKFIFNTIDSKGIIQFKIIGFVEQIELSCSKQNGSLPEGTELTKSNLTFKGPMKVTYAGMYVCVASYQHWKASTWWEIEITSAENQWILTRAVLIATCVVFAASVCFCYVLRWHRRKQLVVIPQQYSIQNIGYQITRDDVYCIKTQQDPRDGASSVNTQQVS
uniref:nectin-1-like n=2 Tax=Pristiophorus japonicus TaxID=55135 RepID=UPI00398E4B16